MVDPSMPEMPQRLLQLGMASGLVLFLLLLFLALFYLWIRPFSIDPKLPGPHRHRWFGVAFGANAEMAPGIPFEWSRWPTISAILSEEWEYQTWGGPTMNIGFGGAFFNVVAPPNLEHILKTNHTNYVKGKLAKSFSELMGQESAFSTDGDSWRFHRKIAVAVLNKQAVTEGSQFLLEKLRSIEAIWKKRLEQESSIEMDFQGVSSRITLDVFCQLGFGVDLQSIHEDGENNHARGASAFVQALDELQYLIHLRFEDFFWEIKQKLRLGARERRIRTLISTIDDFAYNVIRETMQDEGEDKEATTKGPQNIIHRYLDFSREQGQTTPTKKQLCDLVVGFTMAGRDSTSAALAWTLFELTQHPVVADRIRDEIQKVCPNIEELNLDHIKNLDYLHWAVMEALRLHPPAPEGFRFAVNDDVLPDGTRIPAGSLVMYSAYTINHSKAVWEYPELFNPDRYSGKEPSPFEWATFHGGPRTCPGKSLALMEVKMVLAYLLPRFDFEDAEDHSGDYHWTIFMGMKGGFPVRIKNRGRWY